MKSQWAGKCKGMQTAEGLIIHEWKVNDEIFYQKEPKCICKNEECFKKQQEAATSSSSPPPVVPPSPPTTLPPRSESERTEECSHMLNILWPMAEKKAENAVPVDTDDSKKQRLILAEVMFKKLADCWNRD